MHPIIWHGGVWLKRSVAAYGRITGTIHNTLGQCNGEIKTEPEKRLTAVRTTNDTVTRTLRLLYTLFRFHLYFQRNTTKKYKSHGMTVFILCRDLPKNWCMRCVVWHICAVPLKMWNFYGDECEIILLSFHQWPTYNRCRCWTLKTSKILAMKNWFDRMDGGGMFLVY